VGVCVVGGRGGVGGGGWVLWCGDTRFLEQQYGKNSTMGQPSPEKTHQHPLLTHKKTNLRKSYLPQKHPAFPHLFPSRM